MEEATIRKERRGYLELVEEWTHQAYAWVFV